MHIISLPTWSCGLNCSYCGCSQQGDSIIYKGSGCTFQKEEISAQAWLDIFAEYKADSVEFSGGGEPLKHHDFVNIIKNIGCRWAITSNTLNSKLKELDLSKCGLWTASFHLEVPEQGRTNFLNNLVYLRSQGVPISVTLVATIKNLQETLRWANRLASHGYGVHIHPYYDDPEFSWYDHPEEMEFLEVSGYTAYEDRLFNYKGFLGRKTCNAGSGEYLVIAPNGEKSLCMSDLFFRRESAIQDGFCSERCMFPCDWHFLKVANG